MAKGMRMQNDDVDAVRWALEASDEEVGPACGNVPIWPTIADDHEFREIYTQGARHALAAVRQLLAAGWRP